jgi:hypothetical protein
MNPRGGAGQEGVIASPASSLRLVKVIHTIAWAFFAGCVIAIPFMAWRRAFGVVGVLIGLVMVEVTVLAFNRWRCPLTPIAARFTDDRRPNFDIYLPAWLARWNKEIFGSLFVGGLLFSLARWLRWLG